MKFNSTFLQAYIIFISFYKHVYAVCMDVLVNLISRRIVIRYRRSNTRLNPYCKFSPIYCTHVCSRTNIQWSMFNIDLYIILLYTTHPHVERPTCGCVVQGFPILTARYKCLLFTGPMLGTGFDGKNSKQNNHPHVKLIAVTML